MAGSSKTATNTKTDAQPFKGFAELPGVRLWYTDSGGSGVPIVLLHANTGNADSWQYNIPGFARAGYRAVAFDRRGWGRSLPQPETGPQPGTLAGDLHALVEHLEIDRCHLVAVAGGGFAAYDYVLWHPERLATLTIAASGGAITDEGTRRLRRKTTLPGFSQWPAEFREVSMGYMATHPEGLEQWLAIYHNSRQDGAARQPERTTITYARLETIGVPTLLMPGDQDLQTPPWVMRRQLAHLPGARFILLPEAAHAINWEKPEEFNRNVLEFIGESEKVSGTFFRSGKGS